MLAAHMPQPNKASQHTIVADAYDSRCTRVLDNPSGAHKLRLMLMMLLMLAAHVPNKTKLSARFIAADATDARCMHAVA